MSEGPFKVGDTIKKIGGVMEGIYQILTINNNGYQLFDLEKGTFLFVSTDQGFVKLSGKRRGRGPSKI